MIRYLSAQMQFTCCSPEYAIEPAADSSVFSYCLYGFGAEDIIHSSFLIRLKEWFLLSKARDLMYKSCQAGQIVSEFPQCYIMRRRVPHTRSKMEGGFKLEGRFSASDGLSGLTLRMNSKPSGFNAEVQACSKLEPL
jgi:hypothetical protein